MQISYERSGGFAGIRFHTVINTSELLPEEANTLLELLDEMDFFELPECIENDAMPDHFNYKFTVDDGQRIHTVEVSASAMSEEMQRFVGELQQIARNARE